MSPRLAAHDSAIYLECARCSRASTSCIAAARSWPRSRNSCGCCERVHLDFVRAGARLSRPAKSRRRGDRRAARDADHALRPERARRRSRLQLVLQRRARSCRPAGRSCARRRAKRRSERGEPDAWMITLSRSLIVPFLTFSDRRDLREQAFKAWIRRGENDGEHDNRPIAREILALRTEQARLHGYRRLRRLRAGRPDGRHAGRRRATAGAGLGAGEGEGRCRSATRCARLALAARRNASDRALGLALLRRKSAQGPLRLRRRRAEALLRRSTGCWAPPSIARIACSASASSNGPTSTPIIPTCASSRCATATTQCVGSSCPTTSRARPSAAARG